MEMIGVKCTFQPDGGVQVQQLYLGGKWQSVGQGRQWLDGYGRHVLIMLPDNQVRELLLRADTLTWQLMPTPQPSQIV